MLPGNTHATVDRSFEQQAALEEFIRAEEIEYYKKIIRMVDDLRARHPHLTPAKPRTRPAKSSRPTSATAPRADSSPGAISKLEPSKTDLPSWANLRGQHDCAHENAPSNEASGGGSGLTQPRSRRNAKSKILYAPLMPVPRLRIDEAALLLIDMQEKLMPTIADVERVTHNSVALLKVAEILGIPYMVTEQYPKGLGRTVEVIAGAMEDQSRRIEKTRFSAAVDIVLEQLHAWRRPSVIICGVEAHVCVLQSVLDLQAAGRECFVCIDAVSAGQREQVPWALRRMERAGAVITGVLSAVYEMLVDSDHPSFKACLEHAKGLKQ